VRGFWLGGVRGAGGVFEDLKKGGESMEEFRKEREDPESGVGLDPHQISVLNGR